MIDSDPRERRIEWAAASVTQGEILDAFARHCREELDDVEVLTTTPTRLDLAWRRERSSVELAGNLPGGDEPTLVLAELTEALVTRLLDDPALRARVAVYDLGRLEKANAVRSSIFVHFEWFLRDAYGVKLLTAAMFTRALIARGVLSLGMG